MKPYAFLFHAYHIITNKLRPVIGFVGQTISMRFPTAFRQPLNLCGSIADCRPKRRQPTLARQKGHAFVFRFRPQPPLAASKRQETDPVPFFGVRGSKAFGGDLSPPGPPLPTNTTNHNSHCNNSSYNDIQFVLCCQIDVRQDPDTLGPECSPF